MAAELVGGAFLSSFLNVLLDRLSDPAIINMMKGKKVDQKLLQKLETILSVVEAVLNDAEKKQISNPAVKRWLENLHDAVYDADDLLDEIATKAATRKDPPPGNILSRFLNLQDREMVTRIEEIIARLEDIANHKDILGLEKAMKNNNMSGRIESTSLVQKSDVFVGRDQEREGMVKLLLDDSNDGKLSVIPIWGMGGIGKTTSAQLVFNDERVQQKFNVKTWVCVGEEFDVLKVTKTVVEKATSGPCNLNDLDSIQLHLKNELAGKSFLVVLDDMWSNNYMAWKKLLTPFQCGTEAGRHGGKILVTTRDEKIANMVKSYHHQAHNLSVLNDEDCWSLFANLALLSKDRLGFEKVGREIVKKCKGLPLAVQTLGSLLSTKDDERDWNDILNNEIWDFSEEESEILPALRISYYHLPSYLKRCFVYCSLYPKDYVFDRDELMLLWMAEGLLQQPKSASTLEENLVNLRHLDIEGTKLEEMPKGMGKLKDLQILRYYIVGKHEENGFGELGELVNLGGSFRIEKIENVVNSSEAWKARMVDKKYIHHLCLEWSSGEDSEMVDSQMEKDVLAKLEPHKDLKELTITGYRGTMFPDWVGLSLYHKVTELELSGCRNCWVLPSLGQLPALERLVISNLEKVKMIGGEFYKDDGTDHHHETSFRSLKKLVISRMPCWEEWKSFECDDDDAPFPQLEVLHLEVCPKLRGDLPTFLPSLKGLWISGCEHLGCYLPGAPIIRQLIIYGKQEARMRDYHFPRWKKYQLVESNRWSTCSMP
ncbi:putative disease resistance RPP13-like protein 1 isoform X2 [Arachis hypogaea]|uniref:putative disease resistance RPP13-like protein 1 isoform X2 n=1 Tax=Arachis hypogaea TaxID=3818 RepID=UPI0034E7F6AC